MARPGELRLARIASLRFVDVATRTERAVEAAGPAEWFADGSHFFVKSRDIYTADNALVQRIATSTDHEMWSLQGGYGKFYWAKGYRRPNQDFFRVGGALDADGWPVPVLSIPILDWGAPPRDDRSAHRTLVASRGSVAMFGVDPSYFWLVDLRGEAPVATKIAVPEALASHTFASDPTGRWSVVAKSGRLYASAADSVDRVRALGCAEP